MIYKMHNFALLYDAYWYKDMWQDKAFILQNVHILTRSFTILWNTKQ